LCVLAILVNIVLAADLAEERGKRPLDEEEDWAIVQEDPSHGGPHGNCGWQNGPEDYRECPREFPVSQKGPFQVPYEFEKYKVVPRLLEQGPSHYLEVDYKNLSRRCQPNLGNKVDLCALGEQPRLRWDCDSTKKYTVALIDVTPWGSKNPKVGAFGILWLLVDVPGCRLSAGTPISEYQTPTPLYGVGKMSYAFLVYEQPAYKIDWSEEPKVRSTSYSNRWWRCLDTIVRKYELILFAGNVFFTEYDPCLLAFRATVDLPIPDYLNHADVATNRPVNPYT